MNRATLVRKGMFRRKLSAGLLLFTITVAFLIFGILVGFKTSLDRALPAVEVNRLVVTNRINYTQPLPIQYVGRVASVDGVAAATHQSWFGSYYREPRNFFVSFAVDPEAFLAMYPDKVVLPPGQRAAFVSARTGMIVGEGLANRFGWHLGDRVPVFSGLYSRSTGDRSWDFTIVGIFRSSRAGETASAAYFHYDYLNDTRAFGRDYVGSVIARTRDPRLNDQVTRAIDAEFSNSAFETVTQDETAFGRAFLNQFGNLNLIITLVVAAGFAAVLLIVGNTIMMSVRQRTAEFAVMKTIGFTGGQLLRLVLAESLALSLTGALLGLLLAGAALKSIGAAMAGQIDGIGMGGATLAWGLLCAAFLGLMTGLLPAVAALRNTPIGAMARR